MVFVLLDGDGHAGDPGRRPAADGNGDDVTFTDPAKGATQGVSVSRVKPGLFDSGDPGDALSSAAQTFDDADSPYTDYHQESFNRNVPNHGDNAAELEFTFVRNGKANRARVRVFRFDGALYMVIGAADQDHWDTALRAYETFLDTFHAPA